MTRNMKWTGLIALIITLIVIPIYSLIEPSRQDELRTDHRTNSVVNATDLYAENCAVCHGASGEGIGDNPVLNSPATQSMSVSDLSKVITRGRYNTLMAGWGIDEGGVLTTTQVDDLVTLIQYGNWEFVEQRVAELGLTPPDVIEYEVPEEMLDMLRQLPDGEQVSSAMVLYADNCAACHAPDGSGTIIAPSLNTPELRELSQAAVTETIATGVPGTLMAAWQQILTIDQIDMLVDLIYRWPELTSAGVEFPEAEASLPSSPEMIVDGGRLYQIACKSCHGVDAYGSPMAPALNNQLFLSQTPDAAIYQIIAGGISGTLMPAWGSRLSDYDLQSLVAYLRDFETTAPVIVPPIIEP